MPEPEENNMADENLAAVVHHSGGSYPVVAGWGIRGPGQPGANAG